MHSGIENITIKNVGSLYLLDNRYSTSEFFSNYRYKWSINGKEIRRLVTPCLLTIFVFYQNIWLKQGNIAGNEHLSEEK